MWLSQFHRLSLARFTTFQRRFAGLAGDNPSAKFLFIVVARLPTQIRHCNM